jgi:hypothetical protein
MFKHIIRTLDIPNYEVTAELPPFHAAGTVLAQEHDRLERGHANAHGTIEPIRILGNAVRIGYARMSFLSRCLVVFLRELGWL